MKLASVILDIPTQALDAPYTYAVPEEAGDQPIEVGCAVLVPFGPRQAVGFIIGIEERAEGVSKVVTRQLILLMVQDLI